MLKRSLILAIVVATLLIGSVASFGNLLGIDISHYQYSVNWDTIKASTDFAISKATEAYATDDYLSRNMSESRRVGILRGYYHVARPDLGDSATGEADYFVDTIGALQSGEILMLDMEPQYFNSNCPTWCADFCDRVFSRTGVKPLIYLTSYYVNNYNWSRAISSGYGLDLAYYPSDTNPNNPSTNWGHNTMKQYSVNGSVAGISPVDCDVFNGDANAFMALGAGGGPRVPCMVTNQDGRLQAFVRGRVNGNLYTCWQTAVNSTTWTSWTAIGNSNYAGNPSAVLDNTGIITVAIRAYDGSISNLWQTAPNAYGSWSVGGWGGNVAGDAKIVVNQNGMRQVFVRGGNNVLYTTYETSRSNWIAWTAIGVGSYAGDPSIILDNTGILTVAMRSTTGAVNDLWQTAPNAYASWGTGSWGGNVPGNPVLALNQNGMRQLFVRGGSGYIHTQYENPRGTWYGWNTINTLTTYAGNPAVILDQSGKLNVFCRMTNGSEGVYWETNVNSYLTWSSGGLDGVITNDPAVAKCANGNRQTIITDAVGTMFLRCETSPGVWGGWNSMPGSP